MSEQDLDWVDEIEILDHWGAMANDQAAAMVAWADWMEGGVWVLN